MTVGEICRRDVVVTRPNLPLADAVAMMSARGEDALVVVTDPSGERVPIGIVTSHAIAAVRTWSRTPHLTVADVMDVEFVTASEAEEIGEALLKMQTYALRALPVVNACGGLEGVVTPELAGELSPPDAFGAA